MDAKLGPQVRVHNSVKTGTTIFTVVKTLYKLRRTSKSALCCSLLMLVVLTTFYNSFLRTKFLHILAFFPRGCARTCLVKANFTKIFKSFLRVFASVKISSTMDEDFTFICFNVSALMALIDLLLFRFVNGRPTCVCCCGGKASVDSTQRRSIGVTRSDSRSKIARSAAQGIFSRVSSLFFAVVLLAFFGVVVSPLLVIDAHSMVRGYASVGGSHSLFRKITFTVDDVFSIVKGTVPTLPFFTPHGVPFLTLTTTEVLLVPVFLTNGIRLRSGGLPFSLCTGSVTFVVLVNVGTLDKSFLNALYVV